MKRRRWLAYGCAHCLVVASGGGHAQSSFIAPPRFERPDLASDEGGLWAIMDREEQRLRRSPFRIREQGLQDYLQDVACKLGGAHCADLRVYPLRSPYFNASMAPNGMMQVWSGLLLRLENEAQLAAVIAHEVGHFMQRHSVERLRDVKARAAFGTFLGMFGLVGAVASLATLASAFGFTRDQERQADLVGLDLMEQAGYDPREAAKVWSNLSAELAANPEVDPQRNSPMLATHPDALERSRTLAERAQGKTGRTGEAEFLARVAPLRFDLLSDELKRNRFDETLVLMERLLQRQPGHGELLHFRGETWRQRAQPGDADLAMADLGAAAASGQAPALTHRSLGHLHRLAERHEEARRSFQRYLELAPAAPDAELLRHYLTEGKTS